MQDKRRVKDGIRYGLIYTLVIMLAGAVLLQVSAAGLAGIFSLSDETYQLCIKAIRIITLGYLFVGANITYQGIFQAFGQGVSSLIISLIRLVVVALPLAYLFTTLENAQDMIWWAFPIAEGCALAVALILMKKIAEKKLDGMKETHHAGRAEGIPA